MGKVLHGSATTTEAVRRAIQHSQASLRALAKRYGINQKTVAKWKRRTSVVDLPTGPKEPRSTILPPEEEAVVVAFRRHTLLPLDDCLYALQATIPRLTRSSLHRCLQRHGDQPIAASGRRQRAAEEVQDLSDRLLPRRHRRSANRAGQALSFRRHRSNFQVRGRSAGPQGQYADRARSSWRPLSPPCPTGSRSCSPTMESNSPTCQRTDQAQPPSSAAILSTASVWSYAGKSVTA